MQRRDFMESQNTIRKGQFKPLANIMMEEGLENLILTEYNESKSDRKTANNLRNELVTERGLRETAKGQTLLSDKAQN